MESSAFEKEYMSRFNAQQRKAVRQVDGPVLLLAVPGSGKTTVLVTRLGYMALCCGIKPEEILTVTYTVAATGDMRARCAAHFGEDLAKRFEFRFDCAYVVLGGIKTDSAFRGEKPFDIDMFFQFRISFFVHTVFFDCRVRFIEFFEKGVYKSERNKVWVIRRLKLVRTPAPALFFVRFGKPESAFVENVFHRVGSVGIHGVEIIVYEIRRA